MLDLVESHQICLPPSPVATRLLKMSTSSDKTSPLGSDSTTPNSPSQPSKSVNTALLVLGLAIDAGLWALTYEALTRGPNARPPSASLAARLGIKTKPGRIALSAVPVAGFALEDWWVYLCAEKARHTSTTHSPHFTGGRTETEDGQDSGQLWSSSQDSRALELPKTSTTDNPGYVGSVASPPHPTKLEVSFAEGWGAYIGIIPSSVFMICCVERIWRQRAAGRTTLRGLTTISIKAFVSCVPLSLTVQKYESSVLAVKARRAWDLERERAARTGDFVSTSAEDSGDRWS